MRLELRVDRFRFGKLWVLTPMCILAYQQLSTRRLVLGNTFFCRFHSENKG